jgi:integrase
MGQRRGHGDGSLFFDEQRGRWVGLVDLGHDGAGKRQRRKVTGRTRSEARARLAEVRKQLDAGLPVGPVRATVGEVLEDWLAKGLPPTAKSPNTIDSYTWCVRAHLVPRLGSHRLRELTPDHVHDALTDMAGAGLSGRSLRLVHSVLTRALRRAERHGKVARNVAALVDTPKGPRKASRSLTVHEAEALLTAIVGQRLEPLIICSLMLGLRPGEALGLPWEAVDLDAGTLQVRQALRRERGVLVLGVPKTLKSVRTLNLPAPVVAALRGHRVQQAAERLTVDGHVIPQGWRHAMPHGVRVLKLLRGGLLGLV